MEIKNDAECAELIKKLEKGISPHIINDIILYLEKTKNTEHTITLVKYLNSQNAQAKNSVWALSGQIQMLAQDINKIKKHLNIQ